MQVLKSTVLSVFLLPYSLIAASSGSSLETRMHANLETVKGLFEAQYAPIEWKESLNGWNLDREIAFAKDQVSSYPEITIKDYQIILKNFFKSVKDYHVNVTFYSTESARLPFLVKSVNGRYFITAISRVNMPDGPFQVGDEITSFDLRPISQAMKEFQTDEFQGTSSVDRAFAELFFSKRVGALGQVVPQGQVLVGVKHQKTKTEQTYHISWMYEPEEISNPSLKQATPNSLTAAVLAKDVKRVPFNQREGFKKSMSAPQSKFLSGEGLGSRESFIPALGKKIWASHPQSAFHAYLFETPDGHRYGYIRIPDYDGGENQLKEFKELIARFDLESEGLVIDQLNNPGGSVFYMYALASTLTNLPLQLPPHRIAITQKEIALAVEILPLLETVSSDEEAIDLIGDSFDGLPVTLELAKQMENYFHTILSQWNLGITFTGPVHLWGYTEIQPDLEVAYSKPILVLINELDLSCADLFPAIMQDNKRATLFGTRTGGAGGFVLSAEFPNVFGIKEMSYTGSIASRADQRPIEDLGVVPDVEYHLTEADLKNKYTPYKNAVVQQIKFLTQ